MPAPLTDLGALVDLKAYLDTYPLPAKAAFTPSPAVAQQAMADASGPAGPQGPMPPGAPQGMPPGDPAAMAGAQPPVDPAAAAGGPAPVPQPEPAPPPPQDPAIGQILQMLQQMQQSGAAGGPAGGKPATANIKIEPHEFHALKHDVSTVKHILGEMARVFDIKIPAQHVLSMQPPVPSAPGGDQAAGPVPAAPSGPPPSQIAQQLPALPPIAAKAAGDDWGAVVGAQPGDLRNGGPLLAALARPKKKGKPA